MIFVFTSKKNVEEKHQSLQLTGTNVCNKNDIFEHKQANINVESRRFGVIVTLFSRQSE